MSKKWNLQDIRPVKTSSAPPHRRRKTKSGRTGAGIKAGSHNPKKDEFGVSAGPNFRLFVIIATVLIVVVVGLFIISALTGRAKIMVTPRSTEINVQSVFEAKEKPIADTLSYELMTLEKIAERQTEASGTKEVETQATGEITIHKNTPGAQKLIINTRFESPDGLIFKLFESVTVPGAELSDDGQPIPGSVKAEVYSEAAGEEYNLPPTEKFTIPGLEKDIALFNAIYASSESAFSGGFKGEQLTINESNLDVIRSELQVELTNMLQEQMLVELPAGFILFDSAMVIDFELQPPGGYNEDDLVVIKEKATLKVPLFKAEELAATIAFATIGDYQPSESVRLDDYNKLSFAYQPAVTSGDEIGNEISFLLSGRPIVIWTYDEEQLKSDLASLSRAAFNNKDGVISTYPMIINITAKVSPFWKQSLPSKVNKIEIIETLDEV